MALLAVSGAAAAALLLSGSATSFVPSVAGGSRGLRGAASGFGGARSAQAPAGGFSVHISSVLAAGIASACAVAAISRRGRAAAAKAQRTQVKYNREDSGLVIGGPIVTYAKALASAAEKTKETVPVTKDVFKVRKLMKEDEFLDKLLYIQNKSISVLERADEMIKIMGLESKAMPTFIRFLAKKRRLMQLGRILNEYSLSLYETSSIAPVVVTSAERLTEAQLNKIKEKMTARTGSKEVKLVQVIDPSLIGGFTLAWDFLDPEQLKTPSAGMDLSIAKVLKTAALNEGIVSVF